MAQLRGVTIINPQSPEFSGEIQSLVDRAVLHDIKAVLPFCYVLRNTSDKHMIVYSTRWTITDSSGQVTLQDRTWWNLTTLRGGDAIAPGTSKLVSPIFRLGLPNFGPTGAALSREVQRTLAAFANKPNVAASLETVIFDDGTAMGTDATNAAAQTQARFDAEREVADVISRTLSAQGDGKHSLSGLAPAISGSRSYRVSQPPQYEDSLALHRQNLASMLIKMTLDQLVAFRQRVNKNRDLNVVKQ